MGKETPLFNELSIRHGLEARATGLPIFSPIIHLLAIIYYSRHFTKGKIIERQWLSIFLWTTFG